MTKYSVRRSREFSVISAAEPQVFSIQCGRAASILSCEAQDCVVQERTRSCRGVGQSPEYEVISAAEPQVSSVQCGRAAGVQYSVSSDQYPVVGCRRTVSILSILSIFVLFLLTGTACVTQPRPDERYPEIEGEVGVQWERSSAVPAVDVAPADPAADAINTKEVLRRKFAYWKADRLIREGEALYAKQNYPAAIDKLTRAFKILQAIQPGSADLGGRMRKLRKAIGRAYLDAARENLSAVKNGADRKWLIAAARNIEHAARVQPELKRKAQRLWDKLAEEVAYHEMVAASEGEYFSIEHDPRM